MRSEMDQPDFRNEIVKAIVKAIDSATAEKWPDDEWIDVSDDVILNVYIDMDGKRRATAFQKSDRSLEFGADITYAGDC